MCNQLDNRSCEVVDELHLEITNLEMTISDTKQDYNEVVELINGIMFQLGFHGIAISQELRSKIKKLIINRKVGG